MEAPPPYMPPKRKRNTALIVWLIIGGVVLCCVLPIGALFIFGPGLFKNAVSFAGCAASMVEIRDSIRDYAIDHKGKLPPAETWQDDVRPYYQKRVAVSHQKGIPMIPAEGQWACKVGGQRYGVGYNDEVAAKDELAVEKSRDVVLFQMRTVTDNAHSKYEPQSPEGAPNIMFGARGWLLIRIQGDPILLDKDGEQPISNLKLNKDS